MVAIGVGQDGCRKILGAAEGMKAERENWCSFFVWLKERRHTGVRLIIGDKNLRMLETIPEVFSGCQISALYGTFLQKYLFRYTT